MERTKTLSKKAQKGFTIFSENKPVNTSKMSRLHKKCWRVRLDGCQCYSNSNENNKFKKICLKQIRAVSDCT